MYGPLCGPGSEGSEGSACLWQAGSKGGGIALRAMSFIMLPAASSASFGGSPSRNDTVRNEETIPSAMRRGDLSTQSIMGAVPVCLP